MKGEDYIKKFDHIKECLEAQGVMNFDYNPAFILSVLNCNQWAYLKDCWTHYEMLEKEWKAVYIIPLIKDKKELYTIYLDYLKKKIPTRYIWKLFEKHLSKLFPLHQNERSNYEHICRTDLLISFAWGSLRNHRNNISKIKRDIYGVHKFEDLNEQNKAEFLRCNDLRYTSQRKKWNKFLLRQDINTWLINNIMEINKIAWKEILKCKGIFLDWHCACYVIGCEITNKLWCCNTLRRYDTTTPSLWYAMWQYLATFYKDYEYENDWTGWLWPLWKSKEIVTDSMLYSYASKNGRRPGKTQWKKG